MTECVDWPASLEMSLADVAAERDLLRRFAQRVMEAWPLGDLDGGELQEAAVACGLLAMKTATEPCGESCACADYYSSDEWGDGIECYRHTPLLTGALEAPLTAITRSQAHRRTPKCKSDALTDKEPT